MKGEKKFKTKAFDEDNDAKKLLEQDNEDETEEENETETESEDSEDESEDNSEDKNDDFDHQWEELRKEAPDTSDATRRLAVCNMDWDRIKAVDLLVCFHSFKPPAGHIHSVKIYPSEFGLKRMEEEKLKGPSELVQETLPLDGNEADSSQKGSKYHREKLRQYQISRLKYFYAVVDCDSAETANTLYEQLNGMEYESSSVRFDLRFIPDEMTFEHKAKCVAEKLPDPSEYRPRLFVTSALQQVKVNLTWDETDPRRREFLQKAFTDPESVQNDIKDFLASASSESEDEVDTGDSDLNKNLQNEERIAKFRQLLSELEEKDKKEEEEKNKHDIEVTWEPGFGEKAKEKVKEKLKKASLNPFEERLHDKKQEKKLKKKEQKEKQKQAEDSSDSGDEDEESTKSKNKKKLAELALLSDAKPEVVIEENGGKRKSKSADLEGFVPDLHDPRFLAMYTSSLFNLIPSDQQPKKESGYSLKRSKEKKLKSKGKPFKRSKRH